MKSDFMNFFHEFYHNAFLPKGITTSFLALLPKKDHPRVLSDYRPISLIGCVYKVLSKILDGVVVVNEIIDLARRRKDHCFLMKVDFEKAYDTVNWRYLEDMMRRMGFPDIWIRWMRTCIFNSSMSVLINGSPTADFKVEKGLRQGDPLSLFLFLIAAEGLTGIIKRAVELGLYRGYKVSDNIQFNVLQFADDTIFVGEDNWDNLWSIKSILRSFELVSGLKVNFLKRKIYGLHVADNFMKVASSFLSCNIDSTPFRFLGIPVGANPRRCATWNGIIESMKSKLSSWQGRYLSLGGRVTLINSVLSSLPFYFFSFFKAPVRVLNQLVRKF
ncbi:unnamed protein product [Trifolium pratense]|uniref:Uncharacterized protein n=1 Tax=Trifolium pratense TaxID=57577 RepID=A0ACB0KZM9_TRIPR|nr:unnamed protein product [Trifolium pratense]